MQRTLDAMARGGIYDQLGGGFHRYSTDAVWLVPHFEKMLYDNAQLARVYLHAWQVTGDERYRRVVDRDARLRAARDDRRGGRLLLDAGRRLRGREGAFFVWTPEEVRAAVDDAERRVARSTPSEEATPTARPGAADDDADLFMAAYGVTPAGNFEGRSILSLVKTPEELAAERGLEVEEVARRLDAARARLFAARERRVRPALDDKVLTAWNGLMLAAFAEAARALGRDDYRRAAERNAAFVLDQLRAPDGRLLRTWKDGARQAQRLPRGLRRLRRRPARALPDDLRRALVRGGARARRPRSSTHFAAPDGGFFDTSDDHETLVVRPRSEQDNALPSGGAMAATVLLQARRLHRRGPLPRRRRRRPRAPARAAPRRADRLRAVADRARLRHLADRRGGTHRRGKRSRGCSARSTRGAAGDRRQRHPRRLPRRPSGDLPAPSRRRRQARRHALARCRCWSTASRSTARRPPTSVAPSPAGNR